jgi:aryl-alcohol dehydrogenase-like predicted oxidoreductase
MNKRLLGKTGIELSEAGYGAAALFGKDVLGKQGITEEQAYELIAASIKEGITFFDTGINYGYSEERLGRCISSAVKDGLTKREDLIIETKCGETVNPDGSYGSMDWSSDWLKKSLEISMQRLQVDYIDLFAMHGECEKEKVEDVIQTFEDMKRQGLIRAYGINTFNTGFLEWIAEEKCFDYVMLDYNIIKQDREPLIDKLTSNGIGVIAGMALGQALFSRKVFRIKNRNDLWYMLRTMAHFRSNLSKSKDFRFLTQNEEFTGNQLALRYVLDNPNVSSAVFTTTSIEHLMENLKATEIVMPEELRKQIKDRA